LLRRPLSATQGPSKSGAVVQLLIASVLSLYFEILIIRWLSSEIRIMAYFKNLSLICAFLGLGGGMLLKDKKYDLLPYFPIFLGLLAFLGFSPHGNLLGRVQVPSDSQMWFWFHNYTRGGINTAFFYGIMLTLLSLQVLCFLPLGQITARLMQEMAPLKAY